MNAVVTIYFMKYSSDFHRVALVFSCRYSLQGDTKKYFSIGKYSGELKTVQALDREENSTYTMEVIAVDGRKCFYYSVNSQSKILNNII